MKKSMLTIISILILGYVVILILVYLFQTKLLFFPGPIQSSRVVLNKYSDNEINIIHNDVKLHGWYIRPEKTKAIIYYGGNAEELSLNLDEFELFDEYGIVLINYQGYGKSEGSPGQNEIYSDALFIFDYIHKNYHKPNQEIILFGRSLGSGVATYVASQRNVNKLILVTAYDSITEIAKKHYPFLPVDLIVKHPFNSKEHVKNLKIPTLILSAEYDKIIPFNNTKNLIESFSEHVSSIIVEGTDHNTIQMSQKYWSSINSFLSR